MSQTRTKTFHIGDVLSITTGRLVSPSHIGGVYEILNFMTGDSLFTHQLPRASRECEPWLLRQHPILADERIAIAVALLDQTLNIARNTDHDEAQCGKIITDWLNAVAGIIGGDTLAVEAIPADDHTRRDPIEELTEMAPHANVVVVDPGQEPHHAD